MTTAKGEFQRSGVMAAVCCALLLLALAPARTASAARSLAFFAYGASSPGTIATAKLGTFVSKEVAGVANVRTSNGGSKGNIKRIARGKGDLAATTLDLFKSAVEGRSPFKKKIRGVASVSKTGGFSFFYLVAMKSTGVKTFADLKAKQGSLRIITRQPGTSGELWARRVMAKMGTGYDAIKKAGGKLIHTSNTEAVNLLKDRLADAWFSIGGNPFGPLTQVALTRNLNFIRVPASVQAAMEKEFGYVSQAVPPKGYRGQESAYKTLSTLDIWIVRENLSPKLVYGMLKALARHADEYRSIHPYTRGLDFKKASKGLPNMHPGAVRFFKEQGAM